jgi:hypothetical protein
MVTFMATAHLGKGLQSISKEEAPTGQIMLLPMTVFMRIMVGRGGLKFKVDSKP